MKVLTKVDVQGCVCVCACVAGSNRFLHVLRSRRRGGGYGGIPGEFTASLKTRSCYWAVSMFSCKISKIQRERERPGFNKHASNTA